jgi:NitT/TauT family transport system substrate-binding protein
MQGLVNAVYRALQHIKNSTPEDLVKLVQPQFMGNFKPEVAAREIEYLKPIYSYTGEITEAQFNSGGKVWFSEGTKVAPQPYKDMVDLTFLSKARAKYG